jgi:threonine synthase
MKYYSLNKQSPLVDFKEATIAGQAPDKGLYFPETIPVLSTEWLRLLKNKSKTEIGVEVMRPYVAETIPVDVLEKIVGETISFDFPLIKITENISTLELFHGPTLAFKDVGARFMSRCLGYFSKNATRKITVLVATSGDTGGAVADGFFGVENVDVIILYPSGKVSKVQEKQLTTHGHNIKAIEINGNFDDCQQLVKTAFTDAELQKKLFLTSANSINVARWLPQQLYYFYALQQWEDWSKPPIISVPSGNFGNICAGILANISGLPVQHFIAACNANDTVPVFLNGGAYTPQTAKATISNAMDVGNPSNFIRILELFHHQFSLLKNSVSSDSITDTDTKSTIKKVFEGSGYLLDPHGAVAYLALEKYLQKEKGAKGFFLETAHPVKFPDSVEAITQQPIDIPASVKNIMSKKKEAILMNADFQTFKEFLVALS